MFNNLIVRNSLTDDMANLFFQNIRVVKGVNFRGSDERSLLSTARALLHSRMPENDYLMLWTENYQNASVNQQRALEFIERVERGRDSYSIEERQNTLLCVVLLDGRNGSFDRMDEHLRSNEAYKEIEKVRLFFTKNFKSAAYINEGKRISFIIFETPRSTDTTIRYYHAVQCTLLNVLPWYFDPSGEKKELSELDLNLIRSIAESKYDEYQKCIDKYAELYDFRRQAIRNCLESFETALDRRSERRYTDEIRIINNDLDNLMEQIAQKTRRQREVMTMLEGIRSGIMKKEGNFGIRDMFDNYKDLRFLRAEGDETIVFAVDKYLDSWNETAMENALHNRSSLLYRYLNDEHSDLIEKLFTEIFEKRTISVPMTGLYVLSSDGHLDAVSGDSLGDVKNDYMPNPHIYYYRCIEGFRGDIAEALRSQNFQFAIEIAMQSAGNINFEDSAVMEKWTKWIVYDNCEGRKCFELPDGTRVTLTEAIKWIDSKGEGENEQAD